MAEHEQIGREPTPAPARAAPLVRSIRGRSGAARDLLLARVAIGDGILAGGVVHPDVVAAIAGRAGRGNRLDAAMASWSQAALGIDAARVNVHHDGRAASLAHGVAARAFTVGSDLFFGHGEYRPHTQTGRQLLAHELTHVAQQQGAAVGGELRVTEPDDAHERVAEGVARRVT